jgi:catalase
VFELSKVETPAVRERVVAQLMNIDEAMASRVAHALRLDGKPAAAPTDVRAKRDVKASPALSIISKMKPTLEGRVIGCLVSDGADGVLITALRKAVEQEGGKLKIVAPYIGGVKLAGGENLPGDLRIDGGPSVFFDAVALLVSDAGASELTSEAAAVNFVADAFNHLKIIGHVPAAAPLLRKAGVEKGADQGVVALDGTNAVAGFIAAAKKLRVWEREKKVRIVP